jgi:hypothetical protein
MRIEQAWLRLRAGDRIRNAHWAEEMWIVLQEGYPEGIPINANTARATHIPEGTVKAFRPYIMLHCVDGSFVPYVATQSDLLTEHWQVIHGDGTQDQYAVVIGRPLKDNPQA